MCGICGIVAPGRPPEREAVRAMSELLAHRGPDGDGLFAADGACLGFRRLAIIDTSHAGDQPFASEDGTLQLVHNGEIYNYRELRAELEAKGHRFRSATDTEVILAAYREWGESCVERFNGMWAFAIWDATRKRLFASRDRFGIKPFYYREQSGRLIFASEPKAFQADPDTRLEANESAVLDYLEQGYLDHTEQTFFAGLRKLAPAHCLSYDAAGLRTWRYWQLEPRAQPEGDAAELVRELFFDALRLHLRSDVPAGTALSGGIDSSAIAVGIAHLLRTDVASTVAVGPQQQTFTAYFDDRGFDERPFAEAVVASTDAAPHWISFDAEQLVADLPAIVRAQDEPFGSTSMAAQWYVMREARRSGMTVMLDGQGGDEVFAGYRAFVGMHLADLVAAGRVTRAVAEGRAFGDVHSSAALLVSAARAFAPESVTRRVRARSRGTSGLVHAALRAEAPPALQDGSLFAQRLRRHQQLILTQRGLPELLRYEDRNSMAHSLESRVPFLDYRLVELAFSLPGDELIRDGRTKDVVRRALGDLLPRSVRERRDKLGFVTPEGRWLRGPLGDLAAEVFADPAFAARGWVDPAAARDRLARHRAGELEAGFELWRALNLELWAREFLDAKSVPSRS
jgi:asparagine synthase (glutamine-hydrolysing)